ncbi:MAG: hypothetical protein QOD99_634 [Chthoniobacter sp.]|jgi:lipoprotein-anchoring transpeptidase ErfK/SrfK|nr:hypothetical protein [Chthoniobacter sp.]
MKHVQLVAILFCLVTGSGCQSLQLAIKKKPLPPARPQPPPLFWDDTVTEGKPSIVIALTDQRAYLYKGRRLVGDSTISSGRKGFETPPGHYKITQKDRNHASNLYGDYVDADGEVVKANVDVNKDHRPSGTTFRGAKMPFFMRFSHGYGLHAGYLPGYRASHGCIRMPLEMAHHYFDSSSVGTRVTVEE